MKCKNEVSRPDGNPLCGLEDPGVVCTAYNPGCEYEDCELFVQASDIEGALSVPVQQTSGEISNVFCEYQLQGSTLSIKELRTVESGIPILCHEVEIVRDGGISEAELSAFVTRLIQTATEGRLAAIRECSDTEHDFEGWESFASDLECRTCKLCGYRDFR